MTSQSEPSPALFTAAERDLIRRELGMRFSTFPSVADGLFLRTWRGGPQAGQPRVPVAMQGLIERELVRIGADVHGRPVGLFTKAGIAALRQLAQHRRQLDPMRYAHVRQELGLAIQASEEHT